MEGSKVYQLKKYLEAFTKDELRNIITKVAQDNDMVCTYFLDLMKHEKKWCKLFVRGLSYNTTDKTLKEFYSQYGTVMEAVVVTEKNGDSKGYGFVTFSCSDEAISASKVEYKEIEGRRTQCLLAFKGNPKKKTESGSRDSDDELADEGVTKEYKSFQENTAEKYEDIALRRLFVHNIAWRTTNEKLHETFSQYGLLHEAVVIREKDSLKSKGYGFVTFQTVEGATLALKQPAKIIDGRETRCNLASERGPTNQSQSQNQNQRQRQSQIQSQSQVQNLNQGLNQSLNQGLSLNQNLNLSLNQAQIQAQIQAQAQAQAQTQARVQAQLQAQVRNKAQVQIQAQTQAQNSAINSTINYENIYNMSPKNWMLQNQWQGQYVNVFPNIVSPMIQTPVVQGQSSPKKIKPTNQLLLPVRIPAGSICTGQQVFNCPVGVLSQQSQTPVNVVNTPYFIPSPSVQRTNMNTSTNNKALFFQNKKGGNSKQYTGKNVLRNVTGDDRSDSPQTQNFEEE